MQGQTLPQVFPHALVPLVDHVVVTTPSTLAIPALREVPESKKTFIPSGLSRPIAPRSFGRAATLESVTLGYVGTLDFIKLHPAAIEICERLCECDPSVRFEFYGALVNEELKSQFENTRFPARIQYKGFTEDTAKTLQGFDIFFYPLRPGHYGTGEQVVLEAMASGLPVVAMAGIAESAIIEHGVSGLLAASTDDLVAQVKDLVAAPGHWAELGARAVQRVQDAFSAESARARFTTLYAGLRELPAIAKPAGGLVLKDDDLPRGTQLFLVSVGEAAPVFRDTLSSVDSVRRPAQQTLAALAGGFNARTRGTPQHYLQHFPGDPVLRQWASLFD
ncbi:Glycosyltransferase-like protein [alpha proteobacterium BAL199]|nr:Glycosyltransferase-like protein [alpha proteobacterium BAL199]